MWQQNKKAIIKIKSIIKKIYPTILYVTNLDGIKEVIDRIDSYLTPGGAKTDEETY